MFKPFFFVTYRFTNKYIYICIFFKATLEISLTYKHYIHLRCTVGCFDICIPCEKITPARSGILVASNRNWFWLYRKKIDCREGSWAFTESTSGLKTRAMGTTWSAAAATTFKPSSLHHEPQIQVLEKIMWLLSCDGLRENGRWVEKGLSVPVGGWLLVELFFRQD